MRHCNATQTPEIDHAALRAKYLAERDKRLRPEGQKQYPVTEDGFDEFYEGDPHNPVAPRPPITDEIDVAVLGGGFAGLIAAARLKQAGIENFRVIELGGDFGGVWYWNRYPGIQVDIGKLLLPPAAGGDRLHAEGEVLQAAGVLRARPAHRQALRPVRQCDLSAPWSRDLRWDEEIHRWRIAHQPRRRHPRPVRGHVPGAVQPAETARHPGHQGLHRAHLPHRALGLRLHRRRYDRRAGQVGG